MFDKSPGSCVSDFYAPSPRNWPFIWNGDTGTPACLPVASLEDGKPAIHFTSATGLVTFTRGAGGRELPPGDYLVIGEFTQELADKFGLTLPADLPVPGRFYVGRKVNPFTGAFDEIFLQVIVKQKKGGRASKISRCQGHEIQRLGALGDRARVYRVGRHPGRLPLHFRERR